MPRMAWASAMAGFRQTPPKIISTTEMPKPQVVMANRWPEPRVLAVFQHLIAVHAHTENDHQAGSQELGENIVQHDSTLPHCY